MFMRVTDLVFLFLTRLRFPYLKSVVRLSGKDIGRTQLGR